MNKKARQMKRIYNQSSRAWMTLLKVLALMFVISPFSLQKASAQDMQPLSSILQSEQSASMYVYSFERCAGLLSTLYARFSNYEDKQMQQLASALLMKSASASMGALLMAQDAGLKLTMEQTTQKALAFGSRYSAIMDESWERTGHAISPFIQADQELCLQLVNKIDEALDQ